MTSQTVAVFSTHSLFGECVASLLEGEAGVRVVRIDANLPTAWEDLRHLHPKAIVVAEDEFQRLDTLGLVSETIEAVVIRLHLGDGAMDIYRHWRVAEASAADLRRAIRRTRRDIKPSASLLVPLRASPAALLIPEGAGGEGNH